jgi:pimeloyl-ACP methyl ester carboxylesterase
VMLLVTRRVERSHLDAGGVRLRFAVEGEGLPVLLLHGFAVSGDLNWRLPGIIRAVRARYRVITPDLRGHGRSDKPRGPGAYGQKLADDVLSLLDHLRLNRGALVGYSLGGFVALKLAASHAERLTGVCLIGAGYEPPDNSEFLEALPRLASDLRAGKGIRPLSAHMGAGHLEPGLLHSWLVKLLTRHLVDREALADLVLSLPELAVAEAEVRPIAIPVCAIVGSSDPFRHSAERLIGRVPDCRVTVVPGADHIGLILRKPARAALEDFLDTCAGRSRDRTGRGGPRKS